jgi:hypothetical protein
MSLTSGKVRAIAEYPVVQLNASLKPIWATNQGLLQPNTELISAALTITIKHGHEARLGLQCP